MGILKYLVVVGFIVFIFSLSFFDVCMMVFVELFFLVLDFFLGFELIVGFVIV